MVQVLQERAGRGEGVEGKGKCGAEEVGGVGWNGKWLAEAQAKQVTAEFGSTTLSLAFTKGMCQHLPNAYPAPGTQLRASDT